MKLRKEIANLCIRNFDVDSAKWKRIDQEKQKGVVIVGHARKENSVYATEDIKGTIKIQFMGGARGSRIFIEKGVRGRIEIVVSGVNSFIYIGRFCRLTDVALRSFQDADFIALGNRVSVTRGLTVVSGLGAGTANPAVIIGDDALFSRNIDIRNSDGHPIFSTETMEQLNLPKDNIVIEPHVWVGEGVTILKNVTIGANSIIAAGSVVTHSIARCSIAKGIPAQSQGSERGFFWARSHNAKHIAEAKAYLNAYQPNHEAMVKK